MSGTLDESVTRVVRKVFGTAASLAVVGPLPPAAVEATFARLNEIGGKHGVGLLDLDASRGAAYSYLPGAGLSVKDAVSGVLGVVGAAVGSCVLCCVVLLQQQMGMLARKHT